MQQTYAEDSAGPPSEADIAASEFGRGPMLRDDLMPRLPHVGIGEAARRHPLIVVLPVIVLVATAVAVGLKRMPTYTASVGLQVGGLNLTAPGALSGFSTASAALAAGYSRAVAADPITQAVGKRMNLPQGQVASRISASPVPNSPSFFILATGRSDRSATTLANATADALVGYIGRTATSTIGGDALLSRYRKVTKTLTSARLLADRAQSAYIGQRSATKAAALRNAQTAVAAAQIQANAIATAFESGFQQAGAVPVAQITARATGATSDRTKRLKLFAFIGLVAGLSIGLALAVLRANRRLRKDFAL